MLLDSLGSWDQLLQMLELCHETWWGSWDLTITSVAKTNCPLQSVMVMLIKKIMIEIHCQHLPARNASLCSWRTLAVDCDVQCRTSWIMTVLSYYWVPESTTGGPGPTVFYWPCATILRDMLRTGPCYQKKHPPTCPGKAAAALQSFNMFQLIWCPNEQPPILEIYTLPSGKLT